MKLSEKIRSAMTILQTSRLNGLPSFAADELYNEASKLLLDLEAEAIKQEQIVVEAKPSVVDELLLLLRTTYGADSVQEKILTAFRDDPKIGPGSVAYLPAHVVKSIVKRMDSTSLLAAISTLSLGPVHLFNVRYETLDDEACDISRDEYYDLLNMKRPYYDEYGNERDLSEFHPYFVGNELLKHYLEAVKS